MRLACVLAVLSGCVLPSQDDGIGEEEQGIYNGWKDSESRSVVGIKVAGGGICSGTLIAPNVVLSAAHCLRGGGTTADYHVYFGDDINLNPGLVVGVTDAKFDPAYDPTGATHDLSLFRLDRSVDVPPSPLHRAPVTASDIGKPVRIVGYGRTGGPGTSGARTAGTARLRSVEPTTFKIEIAFANICFGDSGGPAFLSVGGTYELTGVNAVLDQDYCGPGGIEARIDVALASFIDPYLAANTSCPRLADGDSCSLDPPCGPDDTYAGRCEGDELVYCDGDVLRTIDCAELGRACGDSPDAEGFDCVESTGGADPAPCDGFTCDDGECITAAWLCDEIPDCSASEDELDCPENPTTGCTGFACDDGECISAAWLCDQIIDCAASEDELGCPTPPPPDTGPSCYTVNDYDCPLEWEGDTYCDCDCQFDDPDCS